MAGHEYITSEKTVSLTIIVEYIGNGIYYLLCLVRGVTTIIIVHVEGGNLQYVCKNGERKILICLKRQLLCVRIGINICMY